MKVDGFHICIRVLIDPCIIEQWFHIHQKRRYYLAFASIRALDRPALCAGSVEHKKRNNSVAWETIAAFSGCCILYGRVTLLALPTALPLFIVALATWSTNHAIHFNQRDKCKAWKQSSRVQARVRAGAEPEPTPAVNAAKIIHEWGNETTWNKKQSLWHTHFHTRLWRYFIVDSRESNVEIG